MQCHTACTPLLTWTDCIQVDYLPLIWAVHRLGGVVTPANSQFSESDLASQLRDSSASSIFTCLPLLETAIKAAAAAGIPRRRVYLLESPKPVAAAGAAAEASKFKSTHQLAQLGAQLPKHGSLKWRQGQCDGKRQVAFLCYSSGTSGLPVLHLRLRRSAC